MTAKDNLEDGCGTPQTEPKQNRYPIGPDTNPSTAIAFALADQTNQPVEEVEPLYHSIDPGALDRLLGDSPRVHVTFEHLGYRISVGGSGDGQYLEIWEAAV